MDIVAMLSTASHAVNLTRELKNLERDLDAASFKAKMAELYVTVAEIKMALSDAKEVIHIKDGEIRSLKAEIEALKLGETCPICQNGHLKVTRVIDDPTFGVLGHKQHTLTCQNNECNHQQTRKVVPSER